AETTNSKAITSATFTISSTEAPRTAKLTNASALAYGLSKSRDHVMYPGGGRPGVPQDQYPDAGSMYRSPSIPVANSRVIWGGSPGPGPYGDYKPVSVLDNRSYTRSTGNLTDFDYPSGYLNERGVVRSRPVTPGSGYGTLDIGWSGSRTPVSPYIASEKFPKGYSTMGSPRGNRGKSLGAETTRRAEGGRVGSGRGTSSIAQSEPSSGQSTLS
ncbi:hypothetical protein FHG87_003997, partial [Trinorchestia longiramus]